ncbi:ImmA/IrrE family metallo-endopeptidase [Ruminococcaceae bacterium OttesenSCG-928-L11]|nr:ImmA/IrrE family metallo-endopeptidase [Ruminococcaceae bacterium OttesenSCG-928-L11]
MTPTSNAADLREKAAALLLGQRLKSLCIDVRKLRFDRPIRFHSYTEFCRSTRMTIETVSAGKSHGDGFTVLPVSADAPTLVLYNDLQPNRRRRNFTLAHEIGHIYLGHTQDGDSQEREADRFAAELLAPTCLLLECKRRYGTLTADDICELFFISRSAALFTFDRLVTDVDLTETEKKLAADCAGIIPQRLGPVISF